MTTPLPKTIPAQPSAVIESVLALRGAPVVLKFKSGVTVHGDIIEASAGRVATITPWGCPGVRVIVRLEELRSAEVARTTHADLGRIRREQRARFGRTT